LGLLDLRLLELGLALLGLRGLLHS